MIWKMGRLKSTLFPICIFLLCLNLSKSAQYARNDVNELRRKFININEEIWSIISSETNAGAPHTQSQKIALEKHREFIEELEKIMPDREKELSYGLESLNQNRLWMSLYSEMRPIFTLFENFKKIILTENSVPSPEEQYLEFSTTSLDDFTKYKYLRSTVPRSMKKISEYVKGRNLFLNVYLDVAFRPCELRESSNQILYNLYEALALIQLKGYVMTQFAHTILTINDKGKIIFISQKSLCFRKT